MSSRSRPQEVRHDGARARRVSLQKNIAGARRLKQWELPDGIRELDSIRYHGDGPNRTPDAYPRSGEIWRLVSLPLIEAFPLVRLGG